MICKKLNAKDKVVEFENPKLAPIEYTDVIVAPGAQARKLPIPGADQENVFTIRDPDDITALGEYAEMGKKHRQKKKMEHNKKHKPYKTIQTESS